MTSIIGVSGDKITENRIAQAINEIPVGLAVVDANRRFRFRNTLFERQHAYLLLPTPANNLEALMKAIDGRVTAVLSERGQDVSLHSYTYRVTSRNGALRLVIDTGVWYEYSFAPFGEYDTLISCRNVTQEQQVQSDLKDLKFRYEQFYERLPAMIHSVNESGQILNVSDRWLEVMGYERHEVIGRKITRFVSEKSRPLAEQILKKFSSLGDIQSVRYHMVRGNGDIIEVLMSAIPELDRHGKLIRSLAVLSLAESQQSREESLQIVQELAMTALNDMGDALLTCNRAGLVTFINPVGERLTGWLAQEALGQPLGEVIQLRQGKTDKPLKAPLDPVLQKGQVLNYREDTHLVARGEQECRVELSATPTWSGDGEVVGAILILRDVTRAIKTQRQLAFYSQLDPLTRLPNRNTFTQALGTQFETARTSSSQFGLLFIDIDQLRLVNDLYGHNGGDQALRQVGDALRKAARDKDFVARVAGDKFAVILRNTSQESALSFAEKIRRAIADLEVHCGAESRTRLTLSVGVTLVNKASKGPQSALAEAEGACQLAKQRGRNRVQLYESADEGLRSHQAGMAWVNQINESVRTDQMRLLGMPIQALAAGAETGKVRAEVLLRMLASNGTLISPQQFMPAAEHYQVVESVDRWVVEKVFRLLAARQSLEQLDFVAVNLSSRSVANPDFLEFCRQLMQQHPDLCPHLCFEIVESAVLDDLPRALGFMEAVKEQGCLLALDDFGKGSSSFSYLRDLPLDFVRIDGNYIQDLTADPFNQAVVQGMSTLIHGLGKQAMAERVETPEVLDRLRDLGIDYVQGYHIGRAVEIDQLLGGR